MNWTTSDDIKGQVQRLWDQGRILVAGLSDERIFPLSLRLRRPAPQDLSDHFDAVRGWVRSLEAGSKAASGFGYVIEWQEINNRQLGRNHLPVGLTVPSQADACALIGKSLEVASFQTLAQRTLEPFPELGDWLCRRPLTALTHARDWDRILAVLAWFRSHPRSGLFLRQIDVAGVDTKFIETRKGLLAELLDIILSPDAIDTNSAGQKGFEARYGLINKPILLRFRILDERCAIAGLTDITVPVSQFVSLDPQVTRVFITENEINGLAFPPVAKSIVILGLGYAVDLLSNVSWLRAREIHYWGDIDTHGFAMLDRLRARFPLVRSHLMDIATLRAHEALWSVEDAPHIGTLERLTPVEKAPYDALRFDRMGRSVRLEQERISFGWLEQALKVLSVA